MKMINEIDERIEIQAEVAHGTLRGSYPEIEKAVATILDEEVKKRAKVMMIGYAPQGTSLANLAFFYECGRKYGTILDS